MYFFEFNDSLKRWELYNMASNKMLDSCMRLPQHLNFEVDNIKNRLMVVCDDCDENISVYSTDKNKANINSKYLCTKCAIKYN